MVNKHTWYAHYHKGNKGKGYGFSNSQYRTFTAAKEKARRYAIDYWLTTKDYKYDWEWFIDQFWPVPTWPEDWKTRLIQKMLRPTGATTPPSSRASGYDRSSPSRR
jgi:hypothetical protein